MPSNKGVGKRTESSMNAASKTPGGKNSGSTKGLGKRTEASMKAASATPGSSKLSTKGLGAKSEARMMGDTGAKVPGKSGGKMYGNGNASGIGMKSLKGADADKGHGRNKGRLEPPTL